MSCGRGVEDLLLITKPLFVESLLHSKKALQTFLNSVFPCCATPEPPCRARHSGAAPVRFPGGSGGSQGSHPGPGDAPSTQGCAGRVCRRCGRALGRQDFLSESPLSMAEPAPLRFQEPATRFSISAGPGGGICSSGLFLGQFPVPAGRDSAGAPGRGSPAAAGPGARLGLPAPPGRSEAASPKVARPQLR